MNEHVEEDVDVFFGNDRIQKALSDLGLFAIDYTHHRAFASDLWRACGYTSDQMKEALLPQLLHPNDRERVMRKLAALYEGKEDRFDEVFQLRRSDGNWTWVAGSYRVIYRDDQGTPLLYVGHDRDVTDIKKGEEEQRQRLEEFETLRQVVADVNAGLDLSETVSLILDRTRKVIPYDRSTVQLLDGNELQVIGCTGFPYRESILKTKFSYPDPRNPGSKTLQSRLPLVSNDIPLEFPGFLQVEGLDPTRSWMGIPLIANGEVLGLLALDSVKKGFYTSRHRELAEVFAGHVAAAVEKARLIDHLRTMALTDNLTGAGNRHSLQLQGPFFLEKAKREKKPIVALMIDLDKFKSVNDEYGHDVGDQLLKAIAAIIRGCLRAYDLFFRYGGEEFLVLLPDADLNSALEIAHRIRSSAEHTRHEGLQTAATVSVGLGSLLPSESMTLSDLIKVADQALYEAKEDGRNRVVVRHG